MSRLFLTILLILTCFTFTLPALASSPSGPAGAPEALAGQQSIGGSFAIPPSPPHQDEMSVRSETRLGSPQCHPDDTTLENAVPDCLVGPWLKTR